MSVAADDVARRNCGCYGLFGNLGLGVFTSEFNHRQFSHGRSFPFLTIIIPGHVEGDVCLNSGMLDIGRVSLSICLGAYGDGADVAVARLRHLTDFDRVGELIHMLRIMLFLGAANDILLGKYSFCGLFGLVVLANQPPLCAVERVSGAEAEAVVRLSKDTQTVVERIAEAVGRDRFKVHAVFGHVNVAAALGLAHVLGGNNDLLGQFDQLLHGLRQFLHLLRVGKNLHIIVAPVIGCYVFVENNAQFLIQSVFVIKALLREITENLGQQVILGVDACAGEHGIIVGDRGEGGGIEECEQLTDVLAGLRLAARLGNGQRAILVPRQLQQFADVVEESVPLHRLPAGKIAV